MSEKNSMLEKIYDETGIFQAFEAISNVPRGSGYNTKISEFLLNFAKENGIVAQQDSAENIIMVKPASIGMEQFSTVMLQGHMDMVCEKAAGTEHNFMTEGLELNTDGEWIWAEKTTLGADDGIALAYIMALFTDKSLRHPRLEAVITVDEETGMHGAKALSTTDLQAKYLLNLDSEKEGVFLTCCAGGLTCVGTILVEREQRTGMLLKVNIHGLKGGHSGEDIGKHRTNAVSLMGRLLHDLDREFFDRCSNSKEQNDKTQGEMRIKTVYGGNKDNVIPCEAFAEVLLLNIEISDKEEILKRTQKLVDGYYQELQGTEPELVIDVEAEMEIDAYVLDIKSTKNIENLLYLAATGVMERSAKISGLVESSQNLGIFSLKEKSAIVHFSIRSSVTSMKYYLEEKCRILIEICGGKYERHSEYPAWEYREDSRLREYIREAFEKEYGKEPVMQAIHAGLECGLLSEKMPELDIVSMGPDILDIHTVKERMNVESAKRVYGFLKHLLENWKI